MKKLYSLLTLLLPALFSSYDSSAQSMWQDTESTSQPEIHVQDFRALHLEFDEMKSLLKEAPMEELGKHFNSTFEVDIPLPEGGFETFLIERTKLMGDRLLEKYPGIRTFHGHSKNAGYRKIVIDHTYQGFHAMVLIPGDAIYIDPLNRETTSEYISYYKSDFAKVNVPNFTEWETPGMEREQVSLPEPGTPALKNTGDELLTYKLAMATTGEYSSFHGGTEPLVLSAVQTTVARVNEVYETDFSIRLELIDSTELLFQYDAANDPYSNFSGFLLLGENQTVVSSVISDADYDIGHVFSTGGGGIASYRSVCDNNQKAQGVTGSNFPINDPFDIDYVAHEMGHQFGGSHTFNSVAGSCNGNRVSSTAWEPGSGSTIMAYAGICSGDNLQGNSDDFFHSGSHTEITSFTHTGLARLCATITPTGNTLPVVDAGTGAYVLPMETPFELYGSATDSDGDDLTYVWEQMDIGPAGSPNAQNADAPLFRSWQVTTDSFRIFPRLFNLLSNTTAKGEHLPFSFRDLTFRLTVRDNAVGGGGLKWEEIIFPVTDEAGPFLVTFPDSSLDQLEANDLNGIEWDVANTNVSPVNATLVDIYLSTDGGNTWDIQLADDVPNTGFYAAMVPDGLEGQNQCRIKIKGVDNIFFDVSNQNFSIIAYDGTPNNPQSIAETAENVLIYPNPAHDLLHIRTEENIRQIAVIDLLGQEVMMLSGNTKQVNLSTLQSGVYFVKVTLHNDELITRRIVKE